MSTLFQFCFNFVSTLSQHCLNSDSTLSQLCFNFVFQLCFNSDSTLSQFCPEFSSQTVKKSVSILSQLCYKHFQIDVWGKFQSCLMFMLEVWSHLFSSLDSKIPYSSSGHVPLQMIDGGHFFRTPKSTDSRWGKTFFFWCWKKNIVARSERKGFQE